MVKAVLRHGAIEPLSPLPSTWADGQELVIAEALVETGKESLAAWSREIDELAAQVPEDDFDRIDQALAQADQEAKDYVRRQMGLT
ncbi:MAG: hypothetical protein GY722_08020 [bacterium]|nr:hypothetical protein [bacterium]